jgi:hypothetical protein
MGTCEKRKTIYFSTGEEAAPTDIKNGEKYKYARIICM